MRFRAVAGEQNVAMVDRLHTADDVWGGTVEFRPTTVSASENIAIRQSRLSFVGRLPRPYAIILSAILSTAWRRCSGTMRW